MEEVHQSIYHAAEQSVDLNLTSNIYENKYQKNETQEINHRLRYNIGLGPY